MAGTWKTVRVFISSTFRDMHAERDHLVKVVFPALRERLEKYRVYLIDIDLRWGVTREQAENDRVLDLCLQQIEDCRPFFIGILGERYGWVPATFPADALKHFGWIQHHTGKSVTELEIIQGVLRNPQMQNHAFFYFRDPLAIQEVPESRRRAIYMETDPQLIGKLADLKKQIRESDYPAMENYPARWDNDAYDRPTKTNGRLVGLEAFGERVGDQLWQAIQSDLQHPEIPPEETQPDPLTEELDYHDRFMEHRLRVYVGREQINHDLFAFAEGNEPVACLVKGPSGSGKSAVLARFVTDYRSRQPQTLVVPHFVGASPRSTSVREMLRRFCQVLKERFGFAEELPEETARLMVTFREFLSKVPAVERVLLVIDALNQLDEADRGQQLEWLPLHLPPHVKIVVSCITDSGKPEPALIAFEHRQYRLIQIEPLGDAEQREIIRQVPSLSAKTLDEHQIGLLLANPATANPLYLLVALEELRGFGSFDQLNDRIATFPREGDTVTALFTEVIQRLEEEFGQHLVQRILALLASARRGLSERELQELIARLSTNAQSGDLFPVLRQLRPYLLSRAGLLDFYHRNLFKAVRARYLDSPERQRAMHNCLAEYFHEQDFWFEPLEKQRELALTLPPKSRAGNVRKVDELPWQRLQAQQADELATLLTDLAFLEAKAEAGLVFDVIRDFEAALQAIPNRHPLKPILRLLAESLQADVYFLTSHPTCLFQCVWNRAWWYDCPAAAGHYRSVPEKQSILTKLVSRLWLFGKPLLKNRQRLSSEQPHWEQLGPRLANLLETWHNEKEKCLPDFRWLRALRPPSSHLGSGQRAVFRGHQSIVTCVAYSPDGRRIISGAMDQSVRIWDAASGAELLCVHGRDSMTSSVAVSRDGRQFATDSLDNLVQICDVASGANLRRLSGHEDMVSGLAYSPVDERIASASWDKTVRIWDTVSGAELCCLRGHGSQVFCVAFSPDGQRVVSGSKDQTVRVWDAVNGIELHCIRGHGNDVRSVAFSPDGRRVVSGSDQTVRIWDAASGRKLGSLRGHSDVVLSLAYSADGQRIVSGSNDRTIRIWDANGRTELRCLSAYKQGYVTSVAFSPDGQQIVSGSADSAVRLWDAAGGNRLRQLSNHASDVNCLAFSPDGRWLASASSDQTVQVWDTASGTELHCIRGHEGSVLSVAFSPDGQWIASGSKDLTVRIWDAANGAEFRRLHGHLLSVNCVAFSPDGQRLVSGSDENTVRVWDVANGVQILCLGQPCHLPPYSRAEVRSVAFSSDGRWIVSASWDRKVRVWDANSGVELRCLGGNEHSIENVAFSPDGRRIVGDCGSWNQTIVWDTASTDRLDLIQGAKDVVAIATGPPQFPWRVLNDHLNTTIEDAATGAAAAWLPINLKCITTSPAGRIWAGAVREHLCLFALEGANG